MLRTYQRLKIALSVPFHKWESLRTYMGLKTPLLPLHRGKAFGRWKSPYAGRFRGAVPVSCDDVLCTSHLKDNERRLKAGACFNLSSAKLRNSELSISL